MKPKVCSCGKEFEPNTTWQKSCSDLCRQKIYRKNNPIPPKLTKRQKWEKERAAKNEKVSI